VLTNFLGTTDGWVT